MKIWLNYTPVLGGSAERATNEPIRGRADVAKELLLLLASSASTISAASLQHYELRNVAQNVRNC